MRHDPVSVAGRFLVLFVTCLFVSSGGFTKSSHRVPLRYTPESGETLRTIAEKFGVSPEEIENLNSAPLGGNGSILLVRVPRTREEAVELLEEARQAESLGGSGLRRASALYGGILEAARLLDLDSESSPQTEAIEIPSETVAQALLGWGRVNRIENPEEARLAFERVKTFFPDLEEIRDKAERELQRLENDHPEILASLPPSALERFPVRPHFILDVDTERFAKEYPLISLYEALRSIQTDQDPEIDQFVEEIGGIHAIISTLIHLIDSFHLGAWVEKDVFAENPDEAFDRLHVLAVGHLKVPQGEFFEKLDLGSPEGSYEGVEYRQLDKDTFLVVIDDWVYLADEETLRRVIDSREDRSKRPALAKGTAYQRMRRVVGAGATAFVYVDLEWFLEGPALERARKLIPENDEEFFGSLLVSGVLGINSVQGVAAGLGFEEGNLTGSFAVAHEGKGLFYVLQSDPCESRLSGFFPSDVDGLVRLNLTCTPLTRYIEGFLERGFLGTAESIYSVQYQNFLKALSQQIGVVIDPALFLEGGLGTEIALGFRIPEGILPIPNLLLAMPVGEAEKTLEELDARLAGELGIPFVREEREGYWYRHGILPDTEPFVIELSYTFLDGTLLVASHPNLLVDAVEAHRSGHALSTDGDYRSFLDSITTPNNLEVYLSPTAARKLAMYGKSSAFLSMIDPSRPVLRLIAQKSLDEIVKDPDGSGLGLLFAHDRAQLSLRISDIRSWLTAFLSIEAGESPVAEKEELAESK